MWWLTFWMPDTALLRIIFFSFTYLDRIFILFTISSGRSPQGDSAKADRTPRLSSHPADWRGCSRYPWCAPFQRRRQWLRVCWQLQQLWRGSSSGSGIGRGTTFVNPLTLQCYLLDWSDSNSDLPIFSMNLEIISEFLSPVCPVRGWAAILFLSILNTIPVEMLLP